MSVAVVIFSNLEGAGGVQVHHALGTAKEIREAGEDIKIVFDGPGVEAAAAISQRSNSLNAAYKAVEDLVSGACGVCVKSHKVIKAIEGAGISLINDHGHAGLISLSGWETGYYIVETP